MFTLILLFAYFVRFPDKPQKDAPALSPRAIEQRAQWHIPIDQLDYPVCRLYVDSLRAMGAKIYHTSRWMNGVTVEMNDELAAKVRQLTFVTDVEMTRDNSRPRVFFNKRRLPQRQTLTPPTMHTDDQLNLFNLQTLHQAGFEGQGILMAICDGGFYNADTLSCFRQQALQQGYFDFTDDADGFFGSTGTHGTGCLSTISALTADYYGAAVKASYYLMRSEEYDTESPKEMDNLIVALETADSLGVNVFSLSLGYYVFDNSAWDFTQADMDGQTARVSRAATIAARKGMLVCVAAGNEGDQSWRKIDLPADADSVLTVGAVDVEGNIGYFSSYGPAADGRVKPEVCAVGVWASVITPDGYVIHGNGTSFATPLLAGLAASLWSALPQENAMQIRQRIIRSADRYTQPDDRYGYGIPDAWKAYTMSPESIDNTPFPSEEGRGEASKLLHNGQLLIYHGGHIFTPTGQRLL